MSRVKPYCVFCNKTIGNLKTFNDNILSTSAYYLSIRKEKNLHSKDVILPEEVNEYQRYHSVCYSKFSALPQKYRVGPAKHKPSVSTEK